MWNCRLDKVLGHDYVCKNIFEVVTRKNNNESEGDFALNNHRKRHAGLDFLIFPKLGKLNAMLGQEKRG
jgi:hypothetical protein